MKSCMPNYHIQLCLRLFLNTKNCPFKIIKVLRKIITNLLVSVRPLSVKILQKPDYLTESKPLQIVCEVRLSYREQTSSDSLRGRTMSQRANLFR